ncbi:uracil-xanthine permease family protein [Clostridia bacterium OttesenSCG-928-F22]|nr:uracil-xanthine permease family protein [Clostridia bacterium OttesenSCG-928-F22]
MKEKSKIGTQGIYDARTLGLPKMLLLGFQHAFAMFGATVLVPLITGLSISTTLLMAGLGTLFFHLVTKGKVPAFLGSSFAFLGGYAAIAPKLADGSSNLEMLPYACLGVAAAGLVYLVLALLFKVFGAKKIMRFFPPVVTAPIIIAIGLTLAPTAITNCADNWLLAIVALAIIIICNIWGRGMMKIIPIIIAIVGSYILALCIGAVDFTQLADAAWIGLPLQSSAFAFNAFQDGGQALSAIIAILPISLATMMEHIGDISAISATCGKNYIADPGLHRTLLGDGVATTVASLFGGPANTTYGENTGVLALTKVYDPKVIRIAAVVAVVLSFSPKIAALISTIPTAIIGGISLILYGMISGIGLRSVVENKVDFTKSRNLIIVAVVLVSALGLGSNGISFTIGTVTIQLTGLAIAAILGILLNAIIPGNDYEFKETPEAEQPVNFEI